MLFGESLPMLLKIFKGITFSGTLCIFAHTTWQKWKKNMLWLRSTKRQWHISVRTWPISVILQFR